MIFPANQSGTVSVSLRNVQPVPKPERTDNGSARQPAMKVSQTLAQTRPQAGAECASLGVSQKQSTMKITQKTSQNSNPKSNQSFSNVKSGNFLDVHTHI